MAFIATPTTFKLKSVVWALDRPGQSNKSGWTGKRTAVVNPWHGQWYASAEFAVMSGEAGFRSFRSFVAKLKGNLNTFRLPAVTQAQNANSGVTVSVLAAQNATSMSIAGAATALLDGQYITVNGQLLLLTADQSGALLPSFEPPLRQQATVGTKVVTSQPYVLVHLTDSRQSWSAELGPFFNIKFDVEEAIPETDGTAPE